MNALAQALMLPLTSGASVCLGGLSLVQRHRLLLARHDPLTKVPTRELWLARAERALRRPGGLVVVMVDADSLKAVNDSRGHAAGDALLDTLVCRLRIWSGPGGLVGRLGGDEFASCLRASPTTLPERLDELCQDLAAPVPYNGDPLPAGASVGAAMVEQLHPPTIRQALCAADSAMYQAKRSRRGRWRIADERGRPYPVETSPAQRTRTHGPAARLRDDASA